MRATSGKPIVRPAIGLHGEVWHYRCRQVAARTAVASNATARARKLRAEISARAGLVTRRAVRSEIPTGRPHSQKTLVIQNIAVPRALIAGAAIPLEPGCREVDRFRPRPRLCTSRADDLKAVRPAITTNGHSAEMISQIVNAATRGRHSNSNAENFALTAYCAEISAFNIDFVFERTKKLLTDLPNRGLEHPLHSS